MYLCYESMQNNKKKILKKGIKLYDLDEGLITYVVKKRFV